MKIEGGVDLSILYGSPSLPPGKSEDFCNMKSIRFQTRRVSDEVFHDYFCDISQN